MRICSKHKVFAVGIPVNVNENDSTIFRSLPQASQLETGEFTVPKKTKKETDFVVKVKTAWECVDLKL